MIPPLDCEECVHRSQNREKHQDWDDNILKHHPDIKQRVRCFHCHFVADGSLPKSSRNQTRCGNAGKRHHEETKRGWAMDAQYFHTVFLM
jgi:hypothetical protein